jgi:heavy metal translocating P-type ATPase
MTAIKEKENAKSGYGIEWYIALLAVVGIILYLILRFGHPSFQAYANYPLYIVLIVGGGPLVFDLLKKMASFNFSADLLAGLSIVTSVILEQYLAGAFVILMLSGGLTLENYAVKTASRVLEALAKRAPSIAHRKKKESIEDVAAEKIAVGDILVIFPHEICPVDGVVTEGHGVMDEAYLTGEPFLIHKASGSEVLSGAINGDDSLTIRASKLAIDSRYAKIMQVMQESEQKRPYIRRLADQLGAWYTPFAIFLALLAWFFSGESVRFLAVLVIATPCPLLLAIPVAIIGSISLCASRGIVIKNPRVLEQIPICKTMIFDKTGTLTYGQPTLTDQIIFNGIPSQDILKLVASMERYSKHPLSSAILEKAKEEKIQLANAKEINEAKGEGLKGLVEGHEVVITSRKKLEYFGLKNKAALLPKGSGLECLILVDGKLSALYRFHDTPRSESKSFIQHLFKKHGFKRIMIVSGDREEEVRYLADTVGITQVYASKSPEEKVDIVRQETKKQKTAFLGDGINDAPALASATVGIALGGNSDITAEAAGAVIMDNTLERVDEFIHISSRMRKIALQSAVGGMLLSIVGMGIAAFGYLTPVAGAISQEVIDIIVILNALRTIKKPTVLTDISKL